MWRKFRFDPLLSFLSIRAESQWHRSCVCVRVRIISMLSDKFVYTLLESLSLGQLGENCYATGMTSRCHPPVLASATELRGGCICWNESIGSYFPLHAPLWLLLALLFLWIPGPGFYCIVRCSLWWGVAPSYPRRISRQWKCGAPLNCSCFDISI